MFLLQHLTAGTLRIGYIPVILKGLALSSVQTFSDHYVIALDLQ